MKVNVVLILIYFNSRLQLRLYGVLFIIAIGIWSYKTCCPGIKILAPENLKIKMESACNQLITLRREKPGAFCAIASGFLVVLAILGHIISGQWIVLIGLMVAGFISTRHQFKIVNEPRGLFFVLFLISNLGQLIRKSIFFLNR